MRVTKIIREYIEEEVNKAIPTSNLLPEYVRVNQAVDKKIEIISQAVHDLTVRLCKDATAELDLPEGWEIVPRTCYLPLEKKYARSELYLKECELASKARQKRHEVVKDILLEIELGKVDKKDLAEIIQRAVSEA